jgi:hypothetical protein
MATAAQIEANRRNCQTSTSSRTDEGKNRSRLNALDHGCRAHLMVLPTEVFGEYENELQAWRLSFKPRNPVEDVLIERLVSLGWQEKRIDRAQTARLTQRIHHAGIEEAECEKEQALDLGQRLFRDACGPLALHLEEHETSELRPDGEAFRISDYSEDEDHPIRLVHRLQTTRAGCAWLLDQWADLRALLERGVPWLASDKLKIVRLLGRHPIDAIDNTDVARVYLASFMLANQEGNPFQEILNELFPDEMPNYERYLKHRDYAALAPENAVAAQQMLLDLIDQATQRLQEKAEVLRRLVELDAVSAADRLSWDDTPEGERLRRYELTCKRTWLRMFDLLLKTRQKGEELDIATIALVGRSVPTVTMGAIDQSAPTVADVISPPAEAVIPPELPSEANLAKQNAPNEANSHVQAPRQELRDGHKEHRIDTPHLDRKPGGIGTAGKTKSHPVLDRVLAGQNSTLLNLAPIFGGQ